MTIDTVAPGSVYHSSRELHMSRHPTPLPVSFGIEPLRESECLRISLRVQSATDCTLHWGIRSRLGGPWKCPPPEWCPEQTEFTDVAARTPFVPVDGNLREVTLALAQPASRDMLVFVIHLPRENRWIRNGQGDFVIELPSHKPSLDPAELLQREYPHATVRRFPLDAGYRLAVVVIPSATSLHLALACDVDGPLVLHWGLGRRPRSHWQAPATDWLPANSTLHDARAARTPFALRNHLHWLAFDLPLPAIQATPWLNFVLHQTESNAWLKCHQQDLAVQLIERPPAARLGSALLDELADTILEAEVDRSSWTLMHRYHLCHDLIGRTETDPRGLALLFVWLRYSATRQLDWQRNYNTKPRELSQAQDRLTGRIAALWRQHPAARPWARLLLSHLGRGGDGQRVRDEILQIMHRNHLKEVAHDFIEQWHQKLHNNTTPDDVVICQAYLAFLRHHGDLGQFYRVLEQGGVTRQRLLSFERPIRSDPVYLPDRRDALLAEFENYLRILKALHSGADLEAAITALNGRAGELAHDLDVLLDDFRPGLRRADRILSLRERLSQWLVHENDLGLLRDLLFLDLALESALRNEVERCDLGATSPGDLERWLVAAWKNVRLSGDDEELQAAWQHWQAVGSKFGSPDAALRGMSLSERLGRWVQTYTADFSALLQPLASFLGEGCRIDRWVWELFSEEVIRGGPVFALSRVLHVFEARVRREAGVGAWQLISAGPAQGRVRWVDNLLSVQEQRYSEPTVLLAGTVSGEEEVPEGVRAVLTPSRPDLVSHVAVRARNAGLLFASCFDPAVFTQLKGLEGRWLALEPAGGEIRWEETAPAAAPALVASAPVLIRSRREEGSPRWVLTSDEFDAHQVGGKSNNLTKVRSRLPEWIRTPRSLALPFGVCEAVLALPANQAIREQVQQFETNNLPGDLAPQLAGLRQAIGRLVPPAELQQALLAAWQTTGLPALDWNAIWHGVVRVWASKWNDRAVLSRRSRQIPHDAVRMAVLIQEVVPADYAFVLHTVDPIHRDPTQIFIELVLGLGETLVGNHPGRAMGCLVRKTDLAVRLTSYPSKSTALHGKGIIFRSDSNAEDLEGFAGAGLYDSVLAEEAVVRRLDYASERLLQDAGFRDELLRGVARLGLAVEQVLGTPQDIEGAIAGGAYYLVQTRPQVGL